ncbi:hypothetical protein Zmor_019231 [Zophobas morio]|uniref:Uncharacterized protein n=1 Tax=Zophobas morio TaxID=2755281 RepID=A0AA38M920_9CUCU|nr:hypothetical protein Zmor_019231 [Zophobas morio]
MSTLTLINLWIKPFPQLILQEGTLFCRACSKPSFSKLVTASKPNVSKTARVDCNRSRIVVNTHVQNAAIRLLVAPPTSSSWPPKGAERSPEISSSRMELA